jgi:hypothetical protein
MIKPTEGSILAHHLLRQVRCIASGQEFFLFGFWPDFSYFFGSLAAGAARFEILHIFHRATLSREQEVEQKSDRMDVGRHDSDEHGNKLHARHLAQDSHFRERQGQLPD